ncbi:hypothetical protein F4561_004405 [Lipingzhangella halophila]|uniref:Uncharacterized protein n=1 Tax=Lipingzhangella halophila TaxID=1783352 RepID=A0A7W7W5B6_9ACTN|nr:hypothetical protein [Lipingzhangella halophila]MBB4933585.1 hypothetical protein [Lipingzhangella halophila]
MRSMRWFFDDLRIQVVGVLLIGVGLFVLFVGIYREIFDFAWLGLLLACAGALPVGLRIWDRARRRRAALRVVPTELPQPPGWNHHPSAEQFQVRNKSVTFLRMFLPMSPMYLLFAVVMTMLGSIPFGEDGLVPGIAVGVGSAGALAVFFYAKARRGALTTIVRMSPAGVELWDDKGTHIRLRWNAMTSVGPVNTAMVDPRQKIQTGVNNGAGMKVAQLRGTGAIGWGEHALPERSPVWMLERIAAVPRHPQTGAPQVAIPLGQVDPSWLDGRMGAWVQQHRPDLMAQPTG